MKAKAYIIPSFILAAWKKYAQPLVYSVINSFDEVGFDTHISICRFYWQVIKLWANIAAEIFVGEIDRDIQIHVLQDLAIDLSSK